MVSGSLKSLSKEGEGRTDPAEPSLSSGGLTGWLLPVAASHRSLVTRSTREQQEAQAAPLAHPQALGTERSKPLRCSSHFNCPDSGRFTRFVSRVPFSPQELAGWCSPQPCGKQPGGGGSPGAAQPAGHRGTPTQPPGSRCLAAPGV